jgi:hypothetical protein
MIFKKFTSKNTINDLRWDVHNSYFVEDVKGNDVMLLLKGFWKSKEMNTFK